MAEKGQKHTIYQNKQAYDICNSVCKYTYIVSMNYLIWVVLISVCPKTQRLTSKSPIQYKGSPLLSCWPPLYKRLSKYTVYCSYPCLTPRSRMQFPIDQDTQYFRNIDKKWLR